MDAGVIVAIVVGAIILIALFALLGKKGRERKLETRRTEAHELRREAQVRQSQADRHKAEADERAARARKEQAIAEEQAAHAEKHSRFARDRHEKAADLDPDSDGDGTSRRDERRTEVENRR